MVNKFRYKLLKCLLTIKLSLYLLLMANSSKSNMLLKLWIEGQLLLQWRELTLWFLLLKRKLLQCFRIPEQLKRFMKLTDTSCSPLQDFKQMPEFLLTRLEWNVKASDSTMMRSPLLNILPDSLLKPNKSTHKREEWDHLVFLPLWWDLKERNPESIRLNHLEPILYGRQTQLVETPKI